MPTPFEMPPAPGAGEGDSLGEKEEGAVVAGGRTSIFDGENIEEGGDIDAAGSAGCGFSA